MTLPLLLLVPLLYILSSTIVEAQWGSTCNASFSDDWGDPVCDDGDYYGMLWDNTYSGWDYGEDEEERGSAFWRRSFNPYYRPPVTSTSYPRAHAPPQPKPQPVTQPQPVKPPTPAPPPPKKTGLPLGVQPLTKPIAKSYGVTPNEGPKGVISSGPGSFVGTMQYKGKSYLVPEYSIRQSLSKAKPYFSIGDNVKIEHANSSNGHGFCLCKNCVKSDYRCILSSVFYTQLKKDDKDKSLKFKIVSAEKYGGKTAIAFKCSSGYLTRSHTNKGCTTVMPRASFLTYEKDLTEFSTWLWRVVEGSLVFSSLSKKGPPRYLTACTRDFCKKNAPAGTAFEVADWIEDTGYPMSIRFKLTKAY